MSFSILKRHKKILICLISIVCLVSLQAKTIVPEKNTTEKTTKSKPIPQKVIDAIAKKIPVTAPLTVSEKLFIERTANLYHLKAKDLEKILHEAQYRKKVLDLINHPYESKPWYTYRDFLITPSRIQNGVDFWKKNADTFQYVEDQYNVPAKVIAGILGVETDYGQKLGKFRVLDALTTLSFYYPARTKFFRSQLAEFILYCNANHIDPSSIMGSYAGAIGQPQFMPSSIMDYGVDHSKTGSIDLIHDEGDVIASIANFLEKHDWQKDQPVAILAKVSSRRELHFLLERLHPDLSIAQWELYGVHPTIPTAPTLRARLLSMKIKDGYEYWLVFQNFDVIKTYNNSDNYALAVTVLGTKVQTTYENTSHEKNT